MKSLNGTVITDCLIGMLVISIITNVLLSLNLARSRLDYDRKDEEMIELWESEDTEELYVHQDPGLLEFLIPELVTEGEEEQDSP